MNFLGILGIFLCFHAWAEGDAAVNSAASPQALYESGKFSEALAQWESKREKSAADFYNIGNAHYRLKSPRKALAFYEKALAMTEDSNVREAALANLEVVEKELRDTGALVRDRSLWSGRVVPFVKRLPDWLPWLLLGFSFLALDLVLFRSYRKKVSFRDAVLNPSALISTAAVLVAILGFGIFGMAKQVRLAVIIGDPAVARSGPSPTFTELQKLYPGTKVSLTSSAREGWMQIRIPPNGVGWVSDKDILAL